MTEGVVVAVILAILALWVVWKLAVVVPPDRLD